MRTTGGSPCQKQSVRIPAQTGAGGRIGEHVPLGLEGFFARPTVDTLYPRAQKLWPVKFCRRPE
jgi:hypothetical protein